MIPGSLSRKLTGMNMVVSGIALTLACVSFGIYDLLSLRDNLIAQLSIQAQIVAANSRAQIEFDEPDSAAETLRSLQASPHVMRAQMYVRDGTTLASYVRPGAPEQMPRIELADGEDERYEFSGRGVSLVHRIYDEGVAVGTIQIDSSLSPLYARLANYAVIATFVLLASMLMAFLVSRHVQRAVSDPLVQLAGAARRVAEDETAAVRADVRDDDLLEVRRVAESFNEMVARVEARNRALREAHDELESRVEQRTIELQAINQELESFTYSVSHDLRAPLRHILGFATMLNDRSGQLLDDRGRKYLATITEAASRMGRLIDDLLAFSRMGRASLSPRDVDLSKVVQDARLEITPDTANRNIEWRIDPLPAVWADPALVRPVLVNLLSNAVKYSRQREVARIEVGGRVEGDEAVIFVRDNGVGFDMRYAGKLFGVFQRLHRAEEFDGTGIGLANVRRIIARHGGRTWAEGEVDRGATFYFTLPLARGVPAESRSEERGATQPVSDRDVAAAIQT